MPVRAIAAWPRLMRADVAAQYVGEASADSFRKSVGEGLYSQPVPVPRKGDRWLKESLDDDIDRLSGKIKLVSDAAEIL